ncbi:MAG TPA: S41 family peptidase [Bryobacteraceae bacterium]|nr:S41 family peptidase [Bryobacteraceae bacterium]
MPSYRRPYLIVPVFIVLCSLGAGLYTGRASAASQPDDPVNQNFKQFTKIYAAVERNFADRVDPNVAIYKGAIPGMLHVLDPHSNFFDPKEYAALKEDESGHYFGIGMTVQEHDGKTMVVAPFAGSPAYKAGFRPGDVIVEVNDKKTDGMTSLEVATLLKGPKGTPVQVKVAREGVDQPIAFNLVREEISRSSVPDAFWLKPGIAYLKVEQFNDDTGQDVHDRLKQLGEKNIQGLILDLRENPGGLLTEAVDVAGHFLKKNEVVVSHRGRAQPNKVYTAQSGGTGRDYPIVVLVNRMTASAAEIVSGALQDHDRAWILGETTFGKGLVQTVYPLSENTGLALTTAHYYTPSGRLIQRDYSHISFLDYYYHTNLDQRNTKDVKMTDSGRTVYGGGGITPDQKYTAPKLDKFQSLLLRKYEFYNFSAKFFGARQSTALPKGWSPDASVMNDFENFLHQEKVEFTPADFNSHRDWIQEQLKREMYITAFGVNASDQVAAEQDPEVQAAIQALPKAKALLDAAKKTLVERMDSQRAAR